MERSFKGRLRLLRVTTIPLSLDKLLTGQLKFMSDKGFDVTAVSANGSEIESIKEREDCEHCIIPMTRTISPLADVKALWKMVRLIKKEKPVIVHTHTPKAGLIGMLAAWCLFACIQWQDCHSWKVRAQKENY